MEYEDTMPQAGDFDDMSTIGGDWENETKGGSSVAKGENDSVMQGDIDEDEIEADLAKYYKENELIVDGFKCPDEFLKLITPMEFEEMVALFTRFDSNKSGTIDKHETKKILHFLGMDSSLERAEELLDIVDADKSGEIDFDEFCKFIVMIKRGDERLTKFGSMLDKLNSTPLGELERQAKNRDLKIRFVIVEERPASLMNPTLYVVEVHLSGLWYTIVDGDAVGQQITKRFQGMGNTTREAKYAAAAAAIVNMGDSMPGVKFKEGDFSEEWLAWIDDNLLRGVDPGKIVHILASKGFHPHKNTKLMHRILTWNSLEIFIAGHPDLDLSATGSDQNLDEAFFEWIVATVNKGIDGAAVLELLLDRCIDLTQEHLHFSQKLKNNELGILMAKNGQTPDILDFWHACKHGYVEDVRIYCKCDIKVNEEKMDRHTTERVKPLALAAMGGHTEVIEILIANGAHVNDVDRRGRIPLHHAALKGCRSACQMLIDKGAMIFAGDHQGNMPLHLAAMNNHFEAVDCLAYCGQDLTRTIYSDKVKARAGCTFDVLVQELFEKFPPTKLSKADTVRYEKVWLDEGARFFLSLMDEDVRYMLPTSCAQIMNDVLARFDPRPETGVFITVEGAAEQKFIKTVPTSAELSTLLRYTYRQAALDSINSWSRTALHVACDANKVNSHEKIISLLINTYGCNVSLRDRHDRRPIELLLGDKIFNNMPSATQLREELLLERRNAVLDKLFDQFAEDERMKTERNREAILQECLDRDANLSHRMWDAIREASIFKKRYGGKQWEMYEDPDTGNYFYTKMPRNRLMGDTFQDYCWELPNIAKALVHRSNAITYLRIIRSTLLRNYGKWECYRDGRTQIEFYYHSESEELLFVAPPEMLWSQIIKDGNKTAERLGYANEWEVWRDMHDNLFYRHYITRDCEWELPLDAVKPTPAEKLCTAYQFKAQAVEQKWYSCEQCNRAWKSSAEGSTRTIKICEPCVFRCHIGHKGVRFMRDSSAICNCAQVLKVISTGMCNACVVSEKQTQIQGAARDARADKAIHRQRNIDSPPMFAMVPRLWADGRWKAQSGWMICRRSLGVRGSGDKATGPAITSGDDSVSAYLSDDESSIASSVTHGSLQVVAVPAATPDGGDYMDHYLGLPLGWVEVFDAEEPATLRFGDKVLCTRYHGIPREYGTVRIEMRSGFYKIKYSEPSLEDEVLHRSHLELISRPKFYCHVERGVSAWSVEAAISDPIESASLTLTGPEWLALFRHSTMRRSFQMWDEMQAPQIDALLYVQYEDYLRELAVLKLQKLVRAKCQIPRPHVEWTSVAFTFDTPQSVQELKRIKGGWAYLRRRANNVGEFLDVEGSEWEEYMDRQTAEYFYWTEEENLYQWVKPELYVRNTKVLETFAIGEEVLYRFPGRRQEEAALITKIRFDDETGEDMYDIVHRYVPDLAYKWINKISIKRAPKEGDALMLANLETKWKNQIRRQREAEDRKAKKDREFKLQQELERLEHMKSISYKIGNKSGAADDSMGISLTTRLMRGRMQRIALEAQEVREEIDQVVGKQRRDRVQAQMDELKETNNGRLTRADILSMTRSLDLKLQLEEKIRVRNEVQVDLLRKKKEAADRDAYLEDFVRETEIQTTTPRSLARRKVIRSVHIGIKRQAERFMVCEWGCGDWFKMGHEQADHQLRRCVKRIIACTLGCPMKHTEEFWLAPQDVDAAAAAARDDLLSQHGSGDHHDKDEAEQEMLGVVTNQQFHETEQCPKRLVICPKQCLEWICFEVLDKHLNELCTKRPAKPLECRLGCGLMFGGKVETLIQAEDDRLQHENEECEQRQVRCNWQFDDGRLCAAQMRACDRGEHRDYHLTLQGILTYTVAGTYIFKVPKNISRMKVQLWGAGGGSGYFLGRRGGPGGGGAFVEAIIDVEPFTVLELIVGSGGRAGVKGTELSAVDIHEQRRRMALRREKEIHLPKGAKLEFDEEEENDMVIESACGVSLGGVPGGGEGYGGGGSWASGGGGGYSIISRRTNKGNQALLVAGGGGGGGSLDGLPGCGLDGTLPGTLLDPINGGSATVDSPGVAGDSGSTYNSAWPATEGAMWTGGNGCEFGAGGGGGYYGGGGGGTNPGISGSGGGGSSYLQLNMVRDFVTIVGHGAKPGGLAHDPPEASGLGEWDKVGGFAGQGGLGDPFVTRHGNNGAIRIIKPGHY